MSLEAYLDQDLTELIIGAAIEVHRNLGPGLLESIYENCLAYELEERNLKYCRQISMPTIYKGRRLENGFRLDYLVENKIILELKAVENILPIHEAQLLTYLRTANKKIGLLINFNVKLLKNGIQRIIL